MGPPPSPYDAELALARQLLGAEPEEFRQLLHRLLRERPPASAGHARALKRRVEALTATGLPVPDTSRLD
ncbi:MAG: hypothetical protein JO247_07000 [Chloroflexi bacterium]|nr:hypothetical protein [Chloroflexota bacterium]